MLSPAEDNITCMEALIQDDTSEKFCDVAVKLNLLMSLVHEIIHKKLGYQKLSFH